MEGKCTIQFVWNRGTTLLSCSSRARCDMASGSSPIQSTLIGLFTHCFPDTFCPKVFLLVFSSPPNQCLHNESMYYFQHKAIHWLLQLILGFFYFGWNYGIDDSCRTNKHWRGPVSGELTFKWVKIIRIPSSVTFAFELL